MVVEIFECEQSTNLNKEMKKGGVIMKQKTLQFIKVAMKASISIACSVYLDPITGFVVDACAGKLVDWVLTRYFR